MFQNPKELCIYQTFFSYEIEYNREVKQKNREENSLHIKADENSLYRKSKRKSLSICYTYDQSSIKLIFIQLLYICILMSVKTIQNEQNITQKTMEICIQV